MADSPDRAEDYWTLLREVAAARPELTPERRDELAALVRQSRLRRCAAAAETAQAMRTIRP